MLLYPRQRTFMLYKKGDPCAIERSRDRTGKGLYFVYCRFFDPFCAFLRRFSSFTREWIVHTVSAVCLHMKQPSLRLPHVCQLLFLSGVLPFLKAGHMRTIIFFMFSAFLSFFLSFFFQVPLSPTLEKRSSDILKFQK